jgi:hypothetical protein
MPKSASISDLERAMPFHLAPNRLERLGAGLGLSAWLLAGQITWAAEPAPLAPAASTASHGGHTQRPQLALDACYGLDGWLWRVELDDARRLVLRTSGDDGRRWSEPQVLDTAGDVVLAQGEQRPKLAFGPGGAVVIAYTQPLAKPYTGEIRLLRSTDGGQTFAPPVTVHADRQVITHRFESIAFDARGRLHVVWIDKRDGEAVRAAGRDPKSYVGASIYHALSTDGGASFGPDLRLAEHSCECCRIALAPTPDGGMAALWRHVFAASERDHGFARLDSTAAVEPVRATLDHWNLNACPHHGPGLTPAAGGGYHAVWYGVRDGVAAVRYGRLGADGQPQGPVRALPDEAAEHADVISAGRRVAIVWRSFDGQATRLRAWLSDDDGATFRLQELGRSDAENDYARLVSRDGRFHAIWRTTAGVHVVPLQP